METSATTAAITGVTGGAGATRLTVEAGTALAMDGADVALTDVAFGTQGLSDYVSGRIDEDVVSLVAEDDPDPTSAAVELPVDTDGRLVALPSRASFGALARAKTAGAATTFESIVDRFDEAFDYVLVDTPPVATNPAVAAVTAADRVALVAPGSTRGVDALQRTRARLTDVGTTDDLAIANRIEAVPDGSIEVAIPESEQSAVAEAPAVTALDEEFAPAVAGVAERLFDHSLEFEFGEEGLADRLRP
jgi:cellulose biosynthesis protein BcsQ